MTEFEYNQWNLAFFFKKNKRSFSWIGGGGIGISTHENIFNSRLVLKFWLNHNFDLPKI